MTEERHQESRQGQVHSGHSGDDQPVQSNSYEGFEGMNYEQRRKPYISRQKNEPSRPSGEDKGHHNP